MVDYYLMNTEFSVIEMTLFYDQKNVTREFLIISEL